MAPQTQNPDRDYIHHQIFVEYCNKRDQVRRATQDTNLTLSPNQERVVVVAARKHLREREGRQSAQWFQYFKSQTDYYLLSLQCKDWPLFKTIQ